MLAKTIKYEDYNGEQREEKFYFNISKAELVELELSKKGGLQQVIQRMIDEEDTYQIIQLFKEIITIAIGKKSDDGKRFIKNPSIAEEFFQTEAYSELLMSFLNNPDEAAKFIQGIIPKDMEEVK